MNCPLLSSSSSSSSPVSPQDALEGVLDTTLDEKEQTLMEERLIVFASRPWKQYTGVYFPMDFTDLIRRIYYSGEEGRTSYVIWRKLSRNKITALHIASYYGQTRLCQALIQIFGYNVNAGDYEPGSNPLRLATLKNHISTVKALIDLGANVNSRGRRQHTPLHVAVIYGYKELAGVLISRGADKEECSMIGTPLQCAAAAAEQGTLQVLLDKNVNSNSENCSLTPLHLAVEQNSMGCVELLLRARAEANTIACGTTPLCHAASYGTTEMVCLLLRFGANPDAMDLYNSTPLENAIRALRYDSAEILLPLTQKFSGYQNLLQMKEHMKFEEYTSKRNSRTRTVFRLAKAFGTLALSKYEYYNAVHWYTVAICEDTSDATVYLYRSICYFYLFMGNKALSDAQKCIRLKGDCAYAYYMEAIAWTLLEDRGKALEVLSTASKLMPKNSKIENTIRHIRQEMALMEEIQG